jgi:non-homologous end joining protein Ku
VAGRPNRAWKGALELTINDVPLFVSCQMYSRVKTRRSKSFKTLAPSGQPMQQGRPIDSGTGKEYDSSESRKAHEVSKGQFVVMPKEAVEQINEGRTKVLSPERFVPVDELDLALAFERYAVRPDVEVAGSDQALNIVWNGLLEREEAMIQRFCVRGVQDAILAVYADARGLWAVLLPFEAEMYSVPAFLFTRNVEAGQLFSNAVEQTYEVGGFDHAMFESQYEARRAQVIQQVIDGSEIEVEKEEPKSAVPDLMAALQAAASTPKPKAKKPAKKAKAVA